MCERGGISETRIHRHTHIHTHTYTSAALYVFVSCMHERGGMSKRERRRASNYEQESVCVGVRVYMTEPTSVALLEREKESE